MQETARTIAKCDRPIQSQSVSRCAINVRPKAGSPQSSCRTCTRKERGRSSFLHSDIEAEDWRVLLSENSEHDAGGVDDGDRDARIAAEWLSNRGARDVCLLRRTRDDRSHVAGC